VQTKYYPSLRTLSGRTLVCNGEEYYILSSTTIMTFSKVNLKELSEQVLNWTDYTCYHKVSRHAVNRQKAE
jgi:hypothetical protein